MTSRLALLACIAMGISFGKAKGASSVDTTFRTLPPELIASMDTQRSFVARVVAEQFPGERITRTPRDFDLLQKIVDAKVIPASATWELQSLGIVFGDALAASVDGLSWWEVTDKYGADPTLRFRETSLHLNALTMILEARRGWPRHRRAGDGKVGSGLRCREGPRDEVSVCRRVPLHAGGMPCPKVQKRTLGRLDRCAAPG
ncbi:MAG: DUF3806 domain-containing protein [Anaeromyxobacter sp.]